LKKTAKSPEGKKATRIRHYAYASAEKTTGLKKKPETRRGIPPKNDPMKGGCNRIWLVAHVSDKS